jgi:hypothetical protein
VAIAVLDRIGDSFSNRHEKDGFLASLELTGLDQPF